MKTVSSQKYQGYIRIFKGNSIKHVIIETALQKKIMGELGTDILLIDNLLVSCLG